MLHPSPSSNQARIASHDEDIDLTPELRTDMKRRQVVLPITRSALVPHFPSPTESDYHSHGNPGVCDTANADSVTRGPESEW